MKKLMVLLCVGFILSSLPAFAGEWEDMFVPPANVAGTPVPLDMSPVVGIRHGAAPYGALPVKGDPKTLDSVRKYPKSGPKEITAMEKAVMETDPLKTWTIPGETFDTISSGKNPSRYRPGKLFMSTNKGVAYVWKAETGDYSCKVQNRISCGNIEIRCIPKPPQPPAEKEKPAESEIPVSLKMLELPSMFSKSPRPFSYKKIGCKDYELNAAAGLLFGRSMTDLWGYTEGGIWDTCWGWGRMIGFYANGDIGKTTEGYNWHSYGFGPQIGLRYLGDAVGSDGRVHPYGFTAKLRLIWARMHGENAPYNMTQEDLLIGLYTEYIRRLNDKVLVGVTFESWLSLDSKIDSSWAGDSPSNRGQVRAVGFVQTKINDNWQNRTGAGVFYQMWDYGFGPTIFSEMRYQEWAMCGISASLLPQNNLIWGPSCRIEYGNKIRMDRDKEIVKGIIAIDENGNPIDETEEENTSDDITKNTGDKNCIICSGNK